MGYIVTASVTGSQGVVTEKGISELVTARNAARVDIYAIRQANLQAICSKEFEGNQSALARHLEYDPNLVNRYLRLTKNIGPKVARHIEARTDKEPSWMDHDHSNVESLELHRIKNSLSASALHLAQKWDAITDESAKRSILQLVDSISTQQRKPKGTSAGNRRRKSPQQ